MQNVIGFSKPGASHENPRFHRVTCNDWGTSRPCLSQPMIVPYGTNIGGKIQATRYAGGRWLWILPLDIICAFEVKFFQMTKCLIRKEAVSKDLLPTAGFKINEGDPRSRKAWGSLLAIANHSDPHSSQAGWGRGPIARHCFSSSMPYMTIPSADAGCGCSLISLFLLFIWLSVAKPDSVKAEIFHLPIRP
jgi:hypothetical protein